MKKRLILCMAFLLLGGQAQAAPSVSGSTGLINTPSADIVREGQFHLGCYHLKEGDAFSFGTNLAKNFEISISDLSEKGGGAGLNLKYLIKPERILTPGLAVGVEDIAGERKRAAYVAASKALPFGIRLHVGYGNGRYDGFFYAVEKQLAAAPVPGVFPDASLIAEYDGKNANYGIRMSLVSGLKINAGWRDHEAYVGLTYNFY